MKKILLVFMAMAWLVCEMQAQLTPAQKYIRTNFSDAWTGFNQGHAGITTFHKKTFDGQKIRSRTDSVIVFYGEKIMRTETEKTTLDGNRIIIEKKGPPLWVKGKSQHVWETYDTTGLFMEKTEYVDDSLGQEIKTIYDNKGALVEMQFLHKGRLARKDVYTYPDPLLVICQSYTEKTQQHKKMICCVTAGGKIDHSEVYDGEGMLTRSERCKYDLRGNRLSCHISKDKKTTYSEECTYDAKNRLISKFNAAYDEKAWYAYNDQDSIVHRLETKKTDTTECTCTYTASEKHCETKDKWGTNFETTFFNDRGQPVRYMLLSQPAGGVKDTIQECLYTYTETGLPLSKTVKRTFTETYTWDYGPGEQSWVERYTVDGGLNQVWYVRCQYGNR